MFPSFCSVSASMTFALSTIGVNGEGSGIGGLQFCAYAVDCEGASKKAQRSTEKRNVPLVRDNKFINSLPATT